MSKLLAMMMNKKYTRLEYIESTGTQYIDTLIRANQDTTIKIKGSTTNSGTQVYGGCSTSANLWGIGQQSSGNYLFGQYYTQSGNERILTNYAGNDDVARTLELRKNEFYIDGQLIGSRTAKTFTTTTIKLFTLNPSSSKSSIKIYLAQIEDENGNLVFDGVPVIRNSDNEIGMLDRVSGQFFGNAETGKFRVPNEVGYTVVGSPTITDGVVSGFSASDYLELNKSLNLSTEKVEIVLDIKLTSFSKDGLCILSANNGLNIQLYRQSTQYKLLNLGGNANSGTKQFVLNTNYKVKFVITSTTLDMYVWENNNWILDVSYTVNYTTISNIVIGDNYTHSGTRVFTGSIDLNETYIKVNNKLWFNGQPA